MDMSLDQKGKELADYLRALPDFEIVQGRRYTDMGAIFVDALLQGGANYDGVRDRVDIVLKDNRVNTTSGFVEMLTETPVNSLLQWDGKKPGWVENIARYFKARGVESKSDLKAWLAIPSNIMELYLEPGMGPKTVDYLKKLAGIPNVAIDRHWKTCLGLAGISYGSYSEAKQIAISAAQHMGIDESTLDTSVWRHIRRSNKPSTKGCAS